MGAGPSLGLVQTEERYVCRPKSNLNTANNNLLAGCLYRCPTDSPRSLDGGRAILIT